MSRYIIIVCSEIERNVLRKEANSIMKKKIAILIIHFFIIFSVYHIFMNEIFPVDNIIGISNGDTLHASEFSWSGLLSGRGVNFVIGLVLSIFKFDLYRAFKFSQLFKMLSMAMFSSIVAVEIEKKINTSDFYKVVAINIATLISVVNPFCVQLFTFITPDWGIDFIMAALAIYFLGEKKYVLAFVFSFLTINSYQAYITLVAIIGICFILIESDFEIKRANVKEVGILAIVTVVPALITIGLMHIKTGSGETSAADVKQMSVDSNSDTGFFHYLIEKSVDIFNKYITRAFIDGYSMVGYKLILIYFCVSVFFIIGVLVFKKKYVGAILTFIGIILMTIAPFSIGLIQAGMYMPTRIVFPFFLSMACIAFIVIKIWDFKYLIAYIVCLSGFLLVLSNSAFNAGLDCYTIYNNDIAIGDEISDMIRIYEEENGINVDTIKVLNWADRTNKMSIVYYDQMHYSYYPEVIMSKTLWSDAGIAPLFKFVSGKDYNVEYMDMDEYSSIFDDYGQGNIILSEQVKFDGNIMYLDIR